MIHHLILKDATENGFYMNNHVGQIIGIFKKILWYIRIDDTFMVLGPGDKKYLTIDTVDVTFYLLYGGTSVENNIICLGFETSEYMKIVSWREYYNA